MAAQTHNSNANDDFVEQDTVPLHWDKLQERRGLGMTKSLRF